MLCTLLPNKTMWLSYRFVWANGLQGALWLEVQSETDMNQVLVKDSRSVKAGNRAAGIKLGSSGSMVN